MPAIVSILFLFDMYLRHWYVPYIFRREHGELALPLDKFTAEEVLYYCVTILALVTFSSGFTRLFALSFANPPPEENVGFDFNPITNLDIIGTILFFLGGFGWGKQIDDQKIRFKRQRLGWFAISLIAPFACLVFAMTAAYIKHFLWTDRVVEVLLNLSVAATAYHVLPIPPLAGSRLVYMILPDERIWYVYTKLGPFLILGLVLFERLSGTPLLSKMIAPAVDAVARFAAYH